MPKTISIALKTLLTTAQDLMACDLYTLTLADGTVLRYCDATVDIVYGGNTYAAGKTGAAPGMARSSIRCALGLQVETLEVDMLYDAGTLILGKTPGAFANAGGFDGAKLAVDKLLTDDLADTTRGVVNLFNGLVTDVEISSTRVTLNVANELVFLNASFPRNYFLPACNNALFDASCGLLKSTFKVSGTASSGGSNKRITSALPQAAGYFDLGYVVVTSGANAGLVRSVKAFSGGGFDLLYPLPAALATGDTFDAYPGCDKTQATCGAKFNNLARFRGFPYVPTPETIELGSNGQSPGSAGGSGGAGQGNIGTGTGGQNTNFKQR